MKMMNPMGETVYYNIIEKHGNIRYIIKAASGQTIPGRDREKKSSRTFAQEHQAEAFLRRHGYRTEA